MHQIWRERRSHPSDRASIGIYHPRGFEQQRPVESGWAGNQGLGRRCDEGRDLHGDEAEECVDEERVDAQQIYHGH